MDGTGRRVIRATGRVVVLGAGLWLLTQDGSSLLAWIGGIIAVFGALALLGGE